MADESVGAFFIYFSQISMFLNGVGVGCFVTNDRRKRGGVFYLFLTNSDVQTVKKVILVNKLSKAQFCTKNHLLQQINCNK